MSSKTMKYIIIILTISIIIAGIVFTILLSSLYVNSTSINDSIIGSWEYTDIADGEYLYSEMYNRYDFYSDKSFEYIYKWTANNYYDIINSVKNGKYKISGNEITLIHDNGNVETYGIKIIDNQLFLERDDNTTYTYIRR